MGESPEAPPEDDVEDVSTTPRVGDAGEERRATEPIEPIEDVDVRPRVGDPDSLRHRQFVDPGDVGT